MMMWIEMIGRRVGRGKEEEEEYNDDDRRNMVPGRQFLVVVREGARHQYRKRQARFAFVPYPSSSFK